MVRLKYSAPLRTAVTVIVAILFVVAALSQAVANEFKEPESELPLSELKLDLHGTYVAEQPARSFAIISADEGPEALFKPGESISESATLKEVRATEIVINHAGKQELIRLKLTTVNAVPATITTAPDAQETSDQKNNATEITEIISRTKNKEIKRPYRLQQFDDIYIEVTNQPDLSEWTTVDKSGLIMHTLLGSFPVAGLSQERALNRITHLFQSHIVNPDIQISIEKYNVFDISGEVAQPGNYDLEPQLTLFGAIAMAGGMTPRASKTKITLTREVNGENQELLVNLNQIIQPGDKIVVPEGFF